MEQGHLDTPLNYFENQNYLITLYSNELGIFFWAFTFQEDDEMVGSFEHPFF